MTEHPRRPRRALGTLYRVWRQVSLKDRLLFLTEILPPSVHRAIEVGWQDADVCDEDHVHECTRITWQFAKGDRVHAWLPDGVDWMATVIQRRMTERDVLSNIYEYLVQAPDGSSVWVAEADLTRAQKEPAP